MDATIDAVVHGSTKQAPPKVVVVGLASCFGCQLQITNAEQYLTKVLGQIDLQYWQLTGNAPMPEEFDVAIIEGAVTTKESAQLVRTLREKAKSVITIGACAVTGGIPAIASAGFAQRAAEVYDDVPEASGELLAPRPVSAYITPDYQVRCCPIDAMDFVDVLEQALYGSIRYARTSTMCGECKHNDTRCFYNKGVMCLGLVTQGVCHARCVNLGRPCNGCGGLSPDANLPQAYRVVEEAGLSAEDFTAALQLFNQVNPAFAPELAASLQVASGEEGEE